MKPKGQIKSDWIYEIVNFPKNSQNILRISTLCTVKALRAEILQTFRGIFGKLMIS